MYFVRNLFVKRFFLKQEEWECIVTLTYLIGFKKASKIFPVRLLKLFIKTFVNSFPKHHQNILSWINLLNISSYKIGLLTFVSIENVDLTLSRLRFYDTVNLLLLLNFSWVKIYFIHIHVGNLVVLIANKFACLI